VQKLKFGQVAGLDGIRGELLRQVHFIQQAELLDNMKAHKHVYALAAGSVVHDLWNLLIPSN
jgi:hypothetical protein